MTFRLIAFKEKSSRYLGCGVYSYYDEDFIDEEYDSIEDALPRIAQLKTFETQEDETGYNILYLASIVDPECYNAELEKLIQIALEKQEKRKRLEQEKKAREKAEREARESEIIRQQELKKLAELKAKYES